MAHKEQNEFCKRIKNRYPNNFLSCSVLEIGSFIVNGTVRDLFSNCDYTGLDISEGPGVDVVCPAQNFKPGRQYDTIISCECLEHNPYWKETIGTANFLLKKGGLMIFTCAGIGRPVHGVSYLEEDGKKKHSNWVTMPNVSNPKWQNDYYKNLSINNILNQSIDFYNEYSDFGFEVDNKKKDLYFWGVKK